METDVTEGRKGKLERTKQGTSSGRKRNSRDTKDRHLGGLGEKRKKGWRLEDMEKGIQEPPDAQRNRRKRRNRHVEEKVGVVEKGKGSIVVAQKMTEKDKGGKERREAWGRSFTKKASGRKGKKEKGGRKRRKRR